MKLSVVSPERWDTSCAYPPRRHVAIASRVSVTVPIWLSLISAEFATPRPIASAMIAGLVTKMSSPTSWTLPPSRSVSAAHPSQSSSARPSSISHTGNRSTISAYRSIISALVSFRPAT